MYAEPLEVWDQLGHTENRSENFSGVSTGDELELDETYLIQDAFTVSGSEQDVYIEEDGSVASTSDYEVDLRDGTVSWNGADNVDIFIRYKTAPVPNEVVIRALETATQEIDDRTNTTYNGLEEVTHTYDIHSTSKKEYVLFNRPVRELKSARFNEANAGEADDFTTLDVGRDGDIYRRDDLSIVLTKEAPLEKGLAKLEVTYDYGYADIPDAINKLCRIMAAQEIFQNTIIGEGVDGRDDYDPRIPTDFINDKEELLDRWTIQRMGEPVPVEA